MTQDELKKLDTIQDAIARSGGKIRAVACTAPDVDRRILDEAMGLLKSAVDTLMDVRFGE